MNNEEETLDPSDWTEARALAHRMVEDAVRHLDEVRERHVWQPNHHGARVISWALCGPPAVQS